MTKRQKLKVARILIAAAMLIALAFIPADGILKLCLYLIPYFIVGYDTLWKALRGCFRLQMFDEDFLMAVATVGALIVGEYPEAVAVMLFNQIGVLFEQYAVGKSRKSIAALMDIRPDYANLEKDGKVAEVSPDEVAVGDIIVIKAGEKVPLDGVIEEGSTTVDTSALTGESVPRTLHAGEEIISGTINLTGHIRVRVTKIFEESTVAKILELVENASAKKAKAENFISKFARWYTPIVVGAAVLLAVIPPLFDGNWSEWVYRDPYCQTHARHRLYQYHFCTRHQRTRSDPRRTRYCEYVGGGICRRRRFRHCHSQRHARAEREKIQITGNAEFQNKG